MVDKVMLEGPNSLVISNAQIVQQDVPCPQHLVGRVIGTGGSTIRDIQAKCGAKIQVYQDVRIIRISAILYFCIGSS